MDFFRIHHIRHIFL